MEALYEERRIDRTGYDVSTQEGMEAASAAMRPIYQRQAERLGLDLDELWETSKEGVFGTVEPALTRLAVAPAEALPGEILFYGANLYLDAFLAGGLWEQERAMGEAIG